MSVGGGLEIGVKFNLSLPDAQAGPERIPGSFVPPQSTTSMHKNSNYNMVRYFATENEKAIFSSAS